MKRALRPAVLVATVALVATGTWVAFRSPFIHGVIAGILGGLVLFMGAVGIAIRRVRSRMEGHLAPPPLPTGPWDYSLELEDLEGHSIASSRFRGEVLILNFWATWCAPCVAEMPGLVRLHGATSDLGVRMACVSREPRDVIMKFVEKRGLAAPIYRLAQDPPDCFKTRAIPATFIIDRRGMIALRHVGAAAWDEDRVVTFVRGLAAAPGA